MMHILYRYWSDSELLYVGITSDPQRRNGEHAHHSEWWHYADRITIERYEDRGLLKEAETHAIRHECPKYNVSENTGNPDRIKRPRLPKHAAPVDTDERRAQADERMARVMEEMCPIGNEWAMSGASKNSRRAA